MTDFCVTLLFSWKTCFTVTTEPICLVYFRGVWGEGGGRLKVVLFVERPNKTNSLSPSPLLACLQFPISSFSRKYMLDIYSFYKCNLHQKGTYQNLLSSHSKCIRIIDLPLLHNWIFWWSLLYRNDVICCMDVFVFLYFTRCIHKTKINFSDVS